MNKNQYKKWEPVDSIPQKLFCHGIHDDYEGFRILLKGKGPISKILRISFDPPLAYRNVDEGSRLDTLNSVELIGTFPLFTVENSVWIDWFHDESMGLYIKSKIVHYAIFTANDCIDIISEVEPTVEWID